MPPRRSATTKTEGRTPVVKEALKLLIVPLMLVVVQTIFNTLGFGGMTFALCLYITALLVFSFFEVDQQGIRRNTDVEEPADYLKRAGIAFLFVLLGLFMWLIAGIWHGLDVTVSAIQNPQETFGDISSGSAFIIKFIYAVISHLTLFAFVDLWINLGIAVKRLAVPN